MVVTAWPTDRIKRIAEAIARAEGYYVIGSIPRQYNNPGNLKPVGLNSVGAAGIRRFDTPEAGWNALYKQVDLMLTNRSSVYTSEMSIGEVAAHYVGMNDPDAVNWARNVATFLGVDVSTRLEEIV